jgi:uncharacterized lipoprotein YddW (UPF0748 family)
MLKSRPRRLILVRSVLALVALGITLVIWQAPVVKVTPSSQIRGVWMTHIGAAMMYYSTRLDEVVANLARHHLNTLYPCVWNRGHTLYPSPVAVAAGGRRKDWSTDLPLWPGDDVLRSLITQAHRQHLRILPWFEYGLMIPLSSPIARAHPDWLTTTLAGDVVPQPMQPLPLLPRPLQNWQLAVTGGNLAWLNPFHPEVQAFLVALIAEVVKTYPVDGIQLDDHFGLPIEMGYDPYTVALYQSQHKGLAPPHDAAEPEWLAWRAQGITQLLEKISHAVKNADPKAVLSVSPNPPRFAYRRYLQDWVQWVKAGLVDEVVVQLYRQDLSVLEHDLYHSGFYHLRQQVPIAIGLYTGPLRQAKPLTRINEEIQRVLSAGYQGVSFFSWETTLWLFKQGTTRQVQQSFITWFQR